MRSLRSSLQELAATLKICPGDWAELQEVTNTQRTWSHLERSGWKWDCGFYQVAFTRLPLQHGEDVHLGGFNLEADLLMFYVYLILT